MKFDEIILLPEEKRSLHSFYFKKSQSQNEIKCFDTLYHDYHFIDANLSNEYDEFNRQVPSVTFSISKKYRKYKIFLRKQMFKLLPNWIAILISLVSLVVSIATLLWQLGIIFQPKG